MSNEIYMSKIPGQASSINSHSIEVTTQELTNDHTNVADNRSEMPPAPPVKPPSTNCELVT